MSSCSGRPLGAAGLPGLVASGPPRPGHPARGTLSCNCSRLGVTWPRTGIGSAQASLAASHGRCWRPGVDTGPGAERQSEHLIAATSLPPPVRHPPAQALLREAAGRAHRSFHSDFCPPSGQALYWSFQIMPSGKSRRVLLRMSGRTGREPGALHTAARFTPPVI